MNRKHLLTGVAVAALMVAGVVQASAADPIYAPEPEMSWAGFYLGGHVGYGGANYRGQDSDGATMLETEPNGFLIGMHAGYNWQRNNRWLFGVEGDLSVMDWRGVQTTTLDTSSGILGEMNALASLRARLGLVMDRSLIYVTGGVAFAQNNMVGASTPADAFPNEPDIVVGGVVGGGIEWMHSQNLSLRVEGLYYIFDEKQTTAGTSGFAELENSYAVRVGASWHY